MVSVGAQPAPRPITQREINVMAAYIEDARSALIDNAGLRQPGEDLNRYLRRIALPVQGETSREYRTRINRYLGLLARSVEVTQARRRLPALRDAGSANLALWERTTYALQLLPARVAYTRTAWESVHILPTPVYSKNAALAAGKTIFDRELAQTVSLLIAIDDNLRDARP